MAFKLDSFHHVPSLLSHYTNAEAAYSIMTGGIGHNKEICFLLKNARDKNDNEELELGIKLIRLIREHLQKRGCHTLFDKMTKFDKVYVNSLTERGNLEHMLGYGHVRLEFDFQGIMLEEPIRECDYIDSAEVEELKRKYCDDFDFYLEKAKSSPQGILYYAEFARTEMGAIFSLPLLKNEKEWKDEYEWRQVFHEQENDSRIVPGWDGKPRMKVYYPSKALTGVTFFLNHDNGDELMPYYDKVRIWLERKGWEAEVKKVSC